jgi:E3 ubiquitin-protein ligase RNF5
VSVISCVCVTLCVCALKCACKWHVREFHSYETKLQGHSVITFRQTEVCGNCSLGYTTVFFLRTVTKKKTFDLSNCSKIVSESYTQSPFYLIEMSSSSSSASSAGGNNPNNNSNNSLNSNNTSSSAKHGHGHGHAHGGTQGGGDADDDSAFICNVCLEVSTRDPVVTQCGHLYCWSCLYRWLNTNHTTCPVCKAGVTRENVIPLFIRGSIKDPRYSNASPMGGTGENDDESVPNRPAGHRPDPVAAQFHVNTQNARNMQYGGLSFSIGFGYFPSLFGLQFQNYPVDPNQQPTQQEEESQAHLSRTLLILGFVVFLALILF